MPAGTRVKICGLRDVVGLNAALDAGAQYIGLVFFPKSPRHVSITEAVAIARVAPPGVAKVALVVDATDALLDEITGELPLDILQLHGNETPARVSEIRNRYRLPVMKAVGVADAGDLDALDTYAKVADQILVDAKPPQNAALPGGNGLSFDWRLIAGRRWPVPWMLAGGLTPDNVGEAIRLTGAKQVDVSSGVERAPGVKSAEMITAFCAAARMD
ncbi:phosphoribosylanthranilate isomerase [Yoonia sp. GPGPB17]|uniref:phosphoribosylanthranilate isomerase n=1 Tax=Yoonia sp. GPGPB17 TaxID=3026147 RepID=UPI0030C528F2